MKKLKPLWIVSAVLFALLGVSVLHGCGTTTKKFTVVGSGN